MQVGVVSCAGNVAATSDVFPARQIIGSVAHIRCNRAKRRRGDPVGGLLRARCQQDRTFAPSTIPAAQHPMPSTISLNSAFAVVMFGLRMISASPATSEA